MYMYVGRYIIILYLSVGGDGDWVYIIVITIIFWLHNERKQIIVIINFFFFHYYYSPNQRVWFDRTVYNCEFVYNSRFGYVGYDIRTYV